MQKSTTAKLRESAMVGLLKDTKWEKNDSGEKKHFYNVHLVITLRKGQTDSFEEQ